jgi:hypothetical protein
MKMRGNFATERTGVNYARTIVENAGSLFKEINLQHDVGQDATIVLVVDGQVRPREVALQIKSGASYVSPDQCHIPASAAHIYFWAHHDLVTLGVVYDPGEATAYWIDLRAASRDHYRSSPKAGTTFTFAKSAWNRLDADQFANILVPTLLGEAPHIPLSTLIEWIGNPDPETHSLGVRVLRARHRHEAAAWDCLTEAFRTRPLDKLTIDAPISFAMLLGHDDIGYYSGQIPNDVRRAAVAAVFSFGKDEIAKALALLPECDFERPSLGYSLMPLWGMTKDSLESLKQIAGDRTYGDEVQERAHFLLVWQDADPEWWRFWRRDDPERRW